VLYRPWDWVGLYGLAAPQCLLLNAVSSLDKQTDILITTLGI